MLAMSVILYLILLLIANSYQKVDYCKFNCKTEKHTVCKRHGNCGPLANCEQKDFGADFRQWVLDIHNELRNKVALGKESNLSEAANMKGLIYDRDLEYVAQCHINTCKMGHDKCRSTQQFDYAGQNLYYGSFVDSEKDVHHVVQRWYDEVKDMDPAVIDAYAKGEEGKGYGHFTQVIWAETSHVGCARSHDKSKNELNHLVACNYGTGGNMLGAPVYLKGQPCSKCGDVSCNKKYAGLCGEATFIHNASKIVTFLITLVIFVFQ